MSDVLLVFVKAPRPGAVKTRLVPALGAEGAAELYRVLAAEEVRATAPTGAEYRRVFFFSPPEARGEMEAWFPGERLVAQEGDDLGARMASAFRQAFEEGAPRVAVVGTDVPWVTRRHVFAALRSLKTRDVAVGPSLDGGYYLLALRQPRPELFEGMAWSTPGVLATTEARAQALGLGVFRLEPLPDIDDAADLRREWPRLVPLLQRHSDLRARLAAAL